MKTAFSTHPLAQSSARPSRAPRRPSPYVSAAQTRSLLADSLAVRTERLQAGDMVTTDQAAELASTTRVTINAWIAKGRAIGLTQTRRGYRLPKWQFEPAIWDSIPRLADALGTSEGWALLSFLETPLGGLDGKTPRQAIEQGDTPRVIELAAAEGT
ncbi:hypothetical protein [Roseateles sp. BYS87W]|uniref:Helix-turn-helix domain-containing protein n=1 Tax=Pelomonas baiyunensis TaxID=3299026 RepID=A0ABW7GUG7_9BURK